MPPCSGRRSRARRWPRSLVWTSRSSMSCSPALVRKEVLGLQSDPRSPEHGQYGFLQDLLRQVAYETLPKHERRAKHLAAAEHLSSALSEDEVAEVVASHLLDAYRLDPDSDDADSLRGESAGGACAGRRAGCLARRIDRGAALLRAGGRARRRSAGAGCGGCTRGRDGDDRGGRRPREASCSSRRSVSTSLVATRMLQRGSRAGSASPSRRKAGSSRRSS